METKQLHLIECENCEGSFSENLIKHYDTGFSEADYCDNCASSLEAQYG